MLYLRSLETHPRRRFAGVRCAAGGGRLESVSIPLLEGTMESSADRELQALLLLSDLQCHERGENGGRTAPRLISFSVCEELAEMGRQGEVPPPEATGVILAGDLYAEPPERLKRGGAGDVQDIWVEFANRFRWVVGVAGNHDLFGGQAGFPDAFSAIPNLHALHGSSVELDGIRIAGISGIEGKPAKPWRYEQGEFNLWFEDLVQDELDLMVLHQGPAIPGTPGTLGDSQINALIRASPTPPALIVFGHRQWPQPVALAGTSTCLSVNERVVLLRRVNCRAAVS